MERQHQNQNDGVSDPWESLDVDDSDLPFLRPCNNLRTHPPKPLVPGPAAAVQAAMRRRNLPGEDGEDPVPTQEYIRRALDGGGACADEDFAGNPWLSALYFLRTNGDCEEALRTPLSSIKNGFDSDRVNLVVAIVKSCTRTGLGDLMVTLKDPTGTISASMHRKVLSEEEHRKNISVGSVLILKKVAVFAPSRSAYYLNITMSNVIKVISKDSGPPLKQNCTPSFRYATEVSGTLNTPNVIGSQERVQGIINNLRKNSELRGSVYSNREKDTRSVAETSFFNNENHKYPVATEKEPTFTNSVTVNNTDKGRVISVDEQPDRDNSSCSIRATTAAANVPEVTGSQGIGTAIENENKISSTAAPDWTEEELDQLSVFDD